MQMAGMDDEGGQMQPRKTEAWQGQLRSPHRLFEMPAEGLRRPAAVTGCCVRSARGTWDRGMLAGLPGPARLPLDPLLPFEALLTLDLPPGRLVGEASGLHVAKAQNPDQQAGQDIGTAVCRCQFCQQQT